MFLYLAFYFVVGLVVGSFVNVLIYRLPRHESIVIPGSHCPECGHAVRPYDNIPVLSYLWLRGKCRDCRKPICVQYPAVELLTGLAFLACALKWDFAAPSFLNSVLIAIFIALVFIDYQHQILPNVLTMPGAVAGILLSPLQALSLYGDPVSYGLAALLSPNDPQRALPWIGSILGALVGGGILLIVGVAYKIIRKRQGLGFGDIKMMAMVGAFLGWRLALLTIFFGSLLGSIIGIFLILFQGKNLQHKLAFGTLLGVAAVFALFLGLPFINWWYAAAGR